MVAAIFGLYALLAIIVAIESSNPISLGSWEISGLILTYLILFFRGGYSLMNFKFYSGLAYQRLLKKAGFKKSHGFHVLHLHTLRKFFRTQADIITNSQRDTAPPRESGFSTLTERTTMVRIQRKVHLPFRTTRELA
jgi:hypothetical protein